MTNSAGTITGRTNLVRRRLQPIASGTDGLLSFIVPDRAQVALLIEMLTLVPLVGKGTYGWAGNDTMYVAVVGFGLARPADPAAAAFAAGPPGVGDRFVDFSYKLPGAVGEKIGLNPAGVPGLVINPGLKLTPADSGVVVVVNDATTAVNAASMATSIGCVLHGWEIPTGELATFPPPESFEAVL